MPPQNIFSFSIKGPLTGHWLIPSARSLAASANYAHVLPEWRAFDMEVSFYSQLDKDFLAKERQFMLDSSIAASGGTSIS